MLRQHTTNKSASVHRLRRTPTLKTHTFKSGLKRFSTSVEGVNSWLTKFRQEFDSQKDTIDEKYELELLPETEAESKCFQFSDPTWSRLYLSEKSKEKLTLGHNRLFTHIGNAYSFPDFRDHPSRFEPSVRSAIWSDPTSTTPKILYQLSPQMPPLLWLPFKPSVGVIQRCIDDIIDVESEAITEDAYDFEAINDRVAEELGKDITEGDAELVHEKVLEVIADRDPEKAKLWPHENTAHLFLGNVSEFSLLESSFMANPFVFNLPIILGSRNTKLRLSSSPVIFSSFRTIFSRSIITLEARHDLQYHMAQESDQNEVMTPVFARINYPSIPRLSGPVPQRYNKLFGSNFPQDVPVDIIAAFLGNKMLGYQPTEEELNDIEATQGKDAVSPMLIAHMSMLRYPGFEDLFLRYYTMDDEEIRVACVKGALEMQQEHLIDAMLAVEKDDEIRSLAETAKERLAAKRKI